MLKQLKSEITALWRELRPVLIRCWLKLLTLARAAWAVVRPLLLSFLQVIVALIILFEEWGYKPLVELLGKLARFRPWARLELWIAGLPPYGALTVFGLPTTILLPLKFVAVYLLANGFVMSAGALFVGAKIASTALVARIFMLTKPALMQIGWFAKAYNWFVPWKEAIFAEIRASWVWRYGRMVKNRIRLEAKQAWQRWKPALQKFSAEWRSKLRAVWIGTRLRIGEFRAALRPRVLSFAAALRGRLHEVWQRVRKAA
jgi:hypothetical protein